MIGILFYTQAHAQRYVDASATGANDGTSWADAFTSLQSAISGATAGTQIYVAKGTYKPTNGTNRNATFQIPSGVEIYGGFVGTEVSFTQVDLDARNLIANTTILSGDIGTIGDVSDNSYIIVRTVNVSSATKVDGVTIEEANNTSSLNGGGWYNEGSGANNSSPTLLNVIFFRNRAFFDGGGMYNTGNTNATLTNCTFLENRATTFYGGGMYNGNNSSPTLTNCIFSKNIGNWFGGGMFNRDNSSPTLINCSFLENVCPTYYGGGMVNEDNSSPVIINCVFWKNTGSFGGGGMYNSGNSTPTITNSTFSKNLGDSFGGGGMTNDGNSVVEIRNSIFWGNTGSNKSWENNSSAIVNVSYSLIQEGSLPTGSSGANNIFGKNALYMDNAVGDLSLQICSPAIIAGSNTLIPAGITTDIVNNPRIRNTTVDMGAYEFQAPLLIPEVNV